MIQVIGLKRLIILSVLLAFNAALGAGLGSCALATGSPAASWVGMPVSMSKALKSAALVCRKKSRG